MPWVFSSRKKKEGDVPVTGTSPGEATAAAAAGGGAADEEGAPLQRQLTEGMEGNINEKNTTVAKEQQDTVQAVGGVAGTTEGTPLDEKEPGAHPVTPGGGGTALSASKLEDQGSDVSGASGGDETISSTQAVLHDEKDLKERDEAARAVQQEMKEKEEESSESPRSAAVSQMLEDVGHHRLPRIKDATKREEMEGSGAFEAERRKYFAEQLYSQTAYFMALRGLVGASTQVLGDFISYSGARLDNQRSSAKSAISIVERSRSSRAKNVPGKEQAASTKRADTHTRGRRSSSGMDVSSSESSDSDEDAVSPTAASSASRVWPRGASVALLPPHAHARGAELGAGGVTPYEVDEAMGDVVVLRAFEEMDATVAHTTLQACTEIETQVLEPVRQLFLKTQEEGDKALRDGHKTLKALKSINKYVLRQYSELEKTLAQESAGAEDKAVGDDQWIATAHYHQAVGQQQVAWSTLNLQMSALLATSSDIVMQRRQALKKAVETVLQKEREMWEGSLSLVTSTENSLERSELTSTDKLDEDIKRQIGTIAASLPHPLKGAGRAQAASPGPSEGVGVAGGAPVGTDALAESVLQDIRHPPTPPSLQAYGYKDATSTLTASPLVIRSDVLEYKEETARLSLGGGGGVWQRALAVLTRDNYLHLFALPKEEESADVSSSSVDAAYTSLTPPFDVANIKKPATTLNPTLSLDLRVNDVTARPNPKREEHQRQFSVTGMQKNKGLKGMFRGESKTTLKLRAPTPEKMTEWVHDSISIAKVVREGGGKIPAVEPQVHEHPPIAKLEEVEISTKEGGEPQEGSADTKLPAPAVAAVEGITGNKAEEGGQKVTGVSAAAAAAEEVMKDEQGQEAAVGAQGAMVGTASTPAGAETTKGGTTQAPEEIASVGEPGTTVITTVTTTTSPAEEP